MKETPTSTACIVDGCEKPGTRHADHEGASWYCDEHGVCGNKNCGLSVEHFTHVVDHGTSPKGHAWTLDTWMCPCAADGRHPVETQRVVVETKAVVEVPKKKTVQDYWSTSV